MKDSVRNPPRGDPDGKNYRIYTTACQYCVVGCGYEAHVWQPDQGTESPAEDTKNLWMSPSWTGPIRSDTHSKVAAVVPDPKCGLNRGNHSIRGGTMGANLTLSKVCPGDEEPSTRERLKSPMLKLGNGAWVEMDWDEAAELVTELVSAATESGTNPRRVGAKMYGYHSLENTYAATTLLYQIIGTPNVAHHDRPSVAGASPGLNDATIEFHAFCYDDLLDCDVVFLLGSNAYECQSVMFQQSIAGRRIVVLDPRETITANYAASTGGLHLQPKVLGADCLILNAIARLVLEEYEKREYSLEIESLKQLVSAMEVEKFKSDSKNRCEKQRAVARILTFEEYARRLKSNPDCDPERVEKITGIPLEHLKTAAGLLVERDLRSAILYEKGLIWGYNYANTAAVANLAVLTFNFNLPNRKREFLGHPIDKLLGRSRRKRGFCGRLGGHQKGWAEPKRIYSDIVRTDQYAELAGDPNSKSSGDYQAKWPIDHYLDFHLAGKVAYEPVSGAPRICFTHPEAIESPENPEDVSLLWVIGCNPAGQMADAKRKWQRIRKRSRVNRSRDNSACREFTKNELKERVRAKSATGVLGLVIIQQDIYPNYTTEFADIILPARAWGETPFTRYNGERRLRVYDKFQDPPAYHGPNGLESSRCRADWEIFRDIGQRLVDAGSHSPNRPMPDLSWDTAEDVFASLAADGASNRSDMLKGLREYVAADPSTRQYHQVLRERKTNGVYLPVRFTGKKLEGKSTIPHQSYEGKPGPFFVDDRWHDVKKHFEENQLQADELWIINGRVNETWNSMFSNIRNSYIKERYPDDLPGTLLEVNPKWAKKQKLNNGDLVKVHSRQGSFVGFISMQSSVQEHCAFALFSYPVSKSTSGVLHRKFLGNGYVNNLTSTYVDPTGPIAAQKYARAKISRLGENNIKFPTYAQRHRAFTGNPYSGDDIQWMTRELLVSRGLPRVNILHRDEHANVVVPGSTHGAFWHTSHKSAKDFLEIPLLGQFPLVHLGEDGRLDPNSSLIIQILEGDADEPRMPLRMSPLPTRHIRRIREWIAKQCPDEEFIEIQTILDYSVRIHAHHFGRPDGDAKTGETIVCDPDFGVGVLNERSDFLTKLTRPVGKFSPSSLMCWRDSTGNVLSDWTDTEFEILTRLLSRRSRLPPIVLGFADVREILNRVVQGTAVTALHGVFWNNLTYDEFIHHKVPFAGGEIQIIRHQDGANSPLVQALRGRGPFERFRMPQARNPVSDPDIRKIERWIDHGCPE